jgi:hypothetical protein
MIFDTSHWLSLAVIREIANLVVPDTGQDERATATFSFDLTLLELLFAHASDIYQVKILIGEKCVVCALHIHSPGYLLATITIKKPGRERQSLQGR